MQALAAGLQADVDQLRAANDKAEAEWTQRLEAAAAAADASRTAADDQAADALAALMSSHAAEIAKLQERASAGHVRGSAGRFC